jgi:hypothetical protein
MVRENVPEKRRGHRELLGFGGGEPEDLAEAL